MILRGWPFVGLVSMQALAHFPCARKVWRTRLFSMSQYSAQMSNMAWRRFNFSDPRHQACWTKWYWCNPGAVLANLAAWVLFRTRQSSIASWPWLESEGVIPVGANPNGWRTVEMCEMKKKNMSLFLTKKKVLWGALNQKKSGLPYLSLPFLPL